MTIYFDMDGTLANFYGVENWLDCLINSDPRPYEEAEPLYQLEQMELLMERLKNNGYQIGIISWLSKSGTVDFNKTVRRVKKEWLEKFFPYATEIHIVKYGTPKWSVAKDRGYLIDDEEKNLFDWGSKYGKSIPASEMMEFLEGLA